MALLIGNDQVAGHRCLVCRFSPNSEVSSDAVLNLFGSIFCGLCSFGAPVSSKSSSNILIQGYRWQSDPQNLDDLLITNEEESFSKNPTADVSDIEDLIKTLHNHQGMFEFGLKYSLQHPIAHEKNSLRH